MIDIRNRNMETGKIYGYRARIGFIVPGSTIETIPIQFYKIVPKGVTLVFTSMGISSVCKEEIEVALKGLEKAAGELAKAKVDVIVLGGSPPVIFGGFGFDKKIIDRIKTVTDIPATTSQTLAVDALNILKVKKLVVASPLRQDQNSLLKQFLQDTGFLVLNVKGLNLQRFDVNLLTSDASYKLTIEACQEVKEFDGVYLPCAPMPTVEIIDKLEKDLGKPVVTSVQAMIWGAFKILGISDTITGYGQLFSTLAKATMKPSVF